ncbi:MAG TPA: excinuclease ABC subunit B, partial [Myxococcales bacterium]|nr:excinuclease ABC subunit B [Myxococcales bacterium]
AEDALATRIQFFGDEIEEICEIDPLRGKVIRRLDKTSIFPASHYVTFAEQRDQAVESIREELAQRLEELRSEDLLLEAQRLQDRTTYDLEMLQQMGYCTGIENYSRHLTGRAEGEAPPTLIDYFPKPFLCILDESHVTVPQLGAMYRGDRSRKETLVRHGFRLPSALDNRPLRFNEWEERVRNVIHVSATPGNWELEQTQGVVVEQVIRPTGLTEPEIEIRPVGSQVDDLLDEIRQCVKVSERVLVTTLTKRTAEDLTEYYRELGVQVRYLHSDVDTLERIAIIRDLRKGLFDVLVGINLLREGLDIPEVILVAILDADKEGFLRSRRSLIQTMGRAARHLNGRVLLYADRITGSMQTAMDETSRRREKQVAHNQEHNITPVSISKPIFELGLGAQEVTENTSPKDALDGLSLKDIRRQIESFKKKMWTLARDEHFEEAARVRDKLKQWEQLELDLS